MHWSLSQHIHLAFSHLECLVTLQYRLLHMHHKSGTKGSWGMQSRFAHAYVGQLEKEERLVRMAIMMHEFEQFHAY